MDSSSFYLGMDRLTKWFNKKLTKDQEDAWFEKIGFMPSRAFDDIISMIHDSEKFFPTPALVKKLYSEWRTNNPHLIAPEHAREPCDECDGNGYIWAWYRPKGMPGYIVDIEPHDYWAGREYACERCDNWKHAFSTKGPMRPKYFWTKEKLVANGMKLEDPYMVDGKRNGAYETIEEMADVVGDHVDDSEIPF